jgi:hypothetical protein
MCMNCVSFRLRIADLLIRVTFGILVTLLHAAVITSRKVTRKKLSYNTYEKVTIYTSVDRDPLFFGEI